MIIQIYQNDDSYILATIDEKHKIDNVSIDYAIDDEELDCFLDAVESCVRNSVNSIIYSGIYYWWVISQV